MSSMCLMLMYSGLKFRCWHQSQNYLHSKSFPIYGCCSYIVECRLFADIENLLCFRFAVMGGWNSRPESPEESRLDSPEYQAFKKCFAVLSDGISEPGWLALQLYSRDMISRDMRREIETLPAPTQTRKLLSAVEDQIITSPTSKFKDFLNVLHNEPSLEHLARKLEEAYSKFIL